jgi:hypothetical protein
VWSVPLAWWTSMTTVSFIHFCIMRPQMPSAPTLSVPFKCAIW